ncbi:MAG: hypothetical protein ABI183_23905 [Polyangiaceae bacterium]
MHVFEGKLTLDNMAQLEKDSEAWHSKSKDKLVEMVVIHPSQSKMTSDERQKMKGIIKRWEHTREASATVILAQGLAGALHRSVLTGLQMAVPAPHPTKVFGTTDAALNWLAPSVQKTCGPEACVGDLIVAVAELSAHFQKRPVRAPMTD